MRPVWIIDGSRAARCVGLSRLNRAWWTVWFCRDAPPADCRFEVNVHGGAFDLAFNNLATSGAVWKMQLGFGARGRKT
jgi:hypothetical protein